MDVLAESGRETLEVGSVRVPPARPARCRRSVIHPDGSDKCRLLDMNSVWRHEGALAIKCHIFFSTGKTMGLKSEEGFNGRGVEGEGVFGLGGSGYGPD